VGREIVREDHAGQARVLELGAAGCRPGISLRGNSDLSGFMQFMGGSELARASSSARKQAACRQTIWFAQARRKFGFTA
jgi:hypothetical protein